VKSICRGWIRSRMRSFWLIGRELRFSMRRRDTMFELFRSGEILPDGRTNEDEKALISTEGNGGGQRTANGR